MHGNGNLLVALESYFDGSGKPAKDSRITLAGMAAEDSVWTDFDNEWRAILHNRNPAAEYMHMREATKLIEGFSPRYGWNDTKVGKLIGDLLIYLSTVKKTKRFRQFFCTVDMDAYRRLEKEGYALDSPVKICNEFCPGIVIAWYVTQYPGLISSAHFFFDRDEPFREPFEKQWQVERNRRLDDSPRQIFWSMIHTVTSADMKCKPALQAADMLAWAINRSHAPKKDQSYKMLASIMREVIPWFGDVWDEKKLRSRYSPRIHRI